MRATRKHLLKAGLGAICVAALAAPLAGQAQAPPTPEGLDVRMDNVPNRTLHATDNRGNLLSFSAAAPRVVQTTRQIRGLPGSVVLRGIDFRPRTGDLYGVGSDSVVYRVNPATALAVAEGPAFRPGLRGRFFGVDFNPTVDLIRLTSDFDQNLRLHPDLGSVVSSDADLNPGEPTVVGSAYVNSRFSATPAQSTVLYALDAGDDVIYRQDPANAGTLVNAKELSINVRGDAGFDIAGVNNVGYIATAPNPTQGAELHRVEPETGRSVSLGTIGTGGLVITGLAAVQDGP